MIQGQGMETGEILARAPGKLILLGEYAVMEGAPALVAAINREARITVRPSRDRHFRISAPVMDVDALPFHLDASGAVVFDAQLGDALADKMKFFAATFAAGWRMRGEAASPAPLEVHLDTADFYHRQHGKIGFGSSAALTVALLGALAARSDSDFFNEARQYPFFRQALEAHRLAQGKMGSGIDVAASTFGGILQYQIAPEGQLPATMIETVSYPPGLYMLAIWTGVSASTRKLVRRVHEFRAREPRRFQQIMEEMGEISFAGCHALFSEDISHFLDAVGAYHQVLTKLGQHSSAPIISPEHQALAAIAYDRGAFYKPSGAGGGDLGIAFSDSPEVLEQVAEQIGRTAYEIVPIHITANGLQITYKEVV